MEVGEALFTIEVFARGLSGCVRSVRMSSIAPLMLRLLSASVCSANKAGVLIREVLKSGKFGVVEKVALHAWKPTFTAILSSHNALLLAFLIDFFAGSE